MRQNAQINWASLKDELERAHGYVMSTSTAVQSTRTYFVTGKPRAC